MAELKIPYVIQEQRRKRNMTQEELAAALGVTAQSVSKWERGGYPDITMLPRIANYFEITVDELIGNDELSREIDIEHFYELIHGGGTREEKIQTAVEYVRKYPKDYRIAHEAAEFLMKLPEDKREPHLPLIRELCEKIIDECTAPALRENAIRMMSGISTDEEFNSKWFRLCAAGYDTYQGEMLEDRLWKQGRYEESRQRFDINNFRLICHFLFRQHRNHGAPERSLEWHVFRLRFLEFLAEDMDVPNAWLGAYAHIHLYAAHAAFGCGKKEEGYAYLEKAMELFPKWCDIPKFSLLDTGNPRGCSPIFGNLKIYKNDWIFRSTIGNNGTGSYFISNNTEEPADMQEPGTIQEYQLATAAANRYFGMKDSGIVQEYCTEMLHFSDSRKKLYFMLTNTSGWPYFNSVREEERYKAIVDRAREMKEAEEERLRSLEARAGEKHEEE